MEDKDDRRFLALPNDRLLVYPDGEMQIINIETGKKFVKFSGDKAELIENDELALIKVYLNGKYYYVNPLNNMIYKN